MNEELSKLLEKRAVVNKEIFELEQKSYFVIAYKRFKNSKQYKEYKELKKILLDNDSEYNEEISKRLSYLEKYGPVNDIIYLNNHCKEVEIYRELREIRELIDNKIEYERLNNNQQSLEDVQLLDKILNLSKIEKYTNTLFINK